MTRRILATIGIVTIFVSLAALVVSCGPNTREKTLRATLVSVNAARDGFVAWDEKHQQQIVDEAKSLEQGKASLADYRDDRTIVAGSFEVVYRALAIAALEPSEKNVAAALAAVSELRDAILRIKGERDP